MGAVRPNFFTIVLGIVAKSRKPFVELNFQDYPNATPTIHEQNERNKIRLFVEQNGRNKLFKRYGNKLHGIILLLFGLITSI